MSEMNNKRKLRFKYLARNYHNEYDEWFFDEPKEVFLNFIKRKQDKDRLWDIADIVHFREKSDYNIEKHILFNLENLNEAIQEQQFTIKKLNETLQSISSKLEKIVNILNLIDKENRQNPELENRFYISSLSGKPSKSMIEFDNVDERIEQFKKKIKEIGSISKRSAIEEE